MSDWDRNRDANKNGAGNCSQSVVSVPEVRRRSVEKTVLLLLCSILLLLLSSTPLACLLLASDPFALFHHGQTILLAFTARYSGALLSPHHHLHGTIEDFHWARLAGAHHRWNELEKSLLLLLLLESFNTCTTAMTRSTRQRPEEKKFFCS